MPDFFLQQQYNKQMIMIRPVRIDPTVIRFLRRFFLTDVVTQLSLTIIELFEGLKSHWESEREYILFSHTYHMLEPKYI